MKKAADCPFSWQFLGCASCWTPRSGVRTLAYQGSVPTNEFARRGVAKTLSLNHILWDQLASFLPLTTSLACPLDAGIEDGVEKVLSHLRNYHLPSRAMGGIMGGRGQPRWPLIMKGRPVGRTDHATIVGL